jgi:uncharacterized RDD family membrane protein YckC
MGTCSITGKIVPEDELVTIQGQRVCAEGKATLLARLKAGETLPGEEEHPTILRRFGCIFLDGLIFGVAYGLLRVAIGFTGSFATPSLIALGGATLLITVVEIIYFGQMHAHGGQTLGKMAGNIFVVNLDGSPIDKSTAYIRSLAYIGPNLISGLTMLTANISLMGIASIVVGCWGIADVVCALLDRNQQRALHDRIAGTRVVYRA